MVVRTSGGLCRARRRSGETLCKPDRPRSRTSWRAGRWAAARRGPGRGCPPPATRLSWGPCWGAAARLKAPRGRGWGPLGGGGAGPPLAVAAARGASAGRPRSSERHSRSSGATAAALQAAVQQARGCKGGRVPTGCASAAGRGRRRTTTTTQEEGGRPRVKPAVYCRPPQAKGARAKRLAAGRCLHYPAQGGKETLYKEIAPAGGFRGDGQCQSPPIDMALISQLPWAAGRSKIRGARARSGAGCPVGGEKKHLGAGAGQRAAASCHPKPAIRGR
ncbi:unnamed protein product [Prorocentrum cordatum]|uniref:Uncharacterized protein n=1 Tax=Prorocentrum cordatum TaxID=2364126 RepID=A0ABN9S3B8_9DINO|nr:unnamed protein product [Polarella glacialis]